MDIVAISLLISNVFLAGILFKLSQIHNELVYANLEDDNEQEAGPV